MRGIILAGGFGSRMQPSTKVINKHLLPVYSEEGAVPMIYYPINTLIKSGVNEIMIITSDEAAGLMIETLGNGSKFGENISFTYKIQNMHDPKVPVGIASALKLAESFVKNELCFAVILGDNFYENTFKDEFTAFEEYSAKHSTESYPDNHLHGHIFLKPVHDPERFGVATLVDGKVTKIVEKPKHPESNYAVTGLYLFDTYILNLLPHLKVSDRGELEVSDINDWIVKSGSMEATVMSGYWSDMGIPMSMVRTQEHINSVGFTLK